MIRIRSISLLALVAITGLISACSDIAGPSRTPSTSASFAKSGTTTGGGGGGTSVPADPTTKSPTQSAPPVAPSYTARIDSIGIVPTAVYYGTPSQWTIGGYIFEANSATHLKPLAGPLVVGACVAVTFSETDGVYNASELKTVSSSKCN